MAESWRPNWLQHIEAIRTYIESLEVKRIVAKLEKEGFIEKKWRRGFMGWVAKGTQGRLVEIFLEGNEG